MSLAVGAVSSSTNMGFEKEGETRRYEESGDERECSHDHDHDHDMKRSESESSFYETGDEGEEDAEGNELQLGPQCTLKEQFEKDKDDESLRKWKEQLLGNVDMNDVGESLEPEVKILSLSILSPGRPDIILPIHEDGKPKSHWFTLKEGCHYSLRFSFRVSRNIVAGFKYTNTVWKTGVKGKPPYPGCDPGAPRLLAHFSQDIMKMYMGEWIRLTANLLFSVDSAKVMLGTFSPQPEAYTNEMPEETTPSGYFARGTYSAKTRFVDDDNKCYLEMNYTFDIRKDWGSIE